MNFSDLKLPAAVAEALAQRGFQSATPVQAAVLDARCIGRDLLVSSQTGSGKTIAFGAAFAQTLLGPRDIATTAGSDAANGDDDDGGDDGGDDVAAGGAGRAAPAPVVARAGASPDPMVLVVVPTRELAVQVRDELGWLLARTGWRMAAFTGGTAVSGDLRTLHRGVDLVIGTPGRLCDLLRRERLSLGNVRVVVLDEGDEMLDLGFREDLQTLLQAAPKTRQTLLLSATLPPEIQALARKFQRNALRIDPRQDGRGSEPGGASAPHDDITYVAHLIASGDRLPVVVNVLRAAGTARAIVFCTTREGVSRLHAALVSRGFAATAISGERAQAERDRALELLRDGDARVLVATNVAARGLHLPDVDLIVHADLPLNAESLTHRSGRTGRAGRKGTAVVIASVGERRKAERLLAAAHIPAVWTPPPSAQAITAAARARLVDEIASAHSPGPAGQVVTAGLDEAIQQLTARLPIEELARRLVARELERLPGGEAVQAVAIPGAGAGAGREGRRSEHETASRRPTSRADFHREGVLFRVNLGARQNAEPRWLLPLICRRGGVTSRDVGAIRVGPDATTFEIAGEAAADFALAASEADPRAPHVTIAKAKEMGRAAPPVAVAAAAPAAAASPRAASPRAASRPAASPPAASQPAISPSVASPPAASPPAASRQVGSRPVVASSSARAVPTSPGVPKDPRPGRRAAAAPPSIELKRNPRHAETPPRKRAAAPATPAPVAPRPGYPPRLQADRGRSDGSSVMRRSPIATPPAVPPQRPAFWKTATRPRPRPGAGGRGHAPHGKQQHDV